MIEVACGVIASAVMGMYFRFTWRVVRRLGLLEQSEARKMPAPDQLTVIIPCRDEAENLPGLLADLNAQSYPVSVVVVDDGSQDGTAQIAQSAGIQVQAVTGAGKKAALAQGFRAVQTPWLATVDADVRLHEDWARTLLSAGIAKDAACVLGGVIIEGGDVAWDRFQQLEFGVMQGWIAGGVRVGQLAMGSGANSLYRTDAYPADALHPEYASGDDAFALNALRKAGISIHWCHDLQGRVRTQPVQTWKELWQQRARWASKTGGQDRETQSTAAIVAAVHGMGAVLCAVLAIQPTTASALLFVGFTGLKMALDERLLRYVRRTFDFKWNVLDAVFFSGRYALLVWGAWWQLLRGQVEWKGRRI